jgi:cardiolipin synthase A/B
VPGRLIPSSVYNGATMKATLQALVADTERATGQSYRAGNRLTVLQNGDEIFPAMLEAIRSAQHAIEFSTYVYWRSDIGSQFADALMERARAGVSVRLLVDAVGGAIMDSRIVWQLERAGVTVTWFRPVRWPYLHKFNNRTHRKILVIDGQIGFTGGVGIAAEWTGNAQDEEHWRETHAQIEGPACLDLAGGFTENWLEATSEQIDVDPPAPAPLGPNQEGTAIQTTISSSSDRPTDIDRLFTAAFTHAQERLWITTAYFVPSNEVMGTLMNAARRGVDVQVLTNGPKTNHKVTRIAGRATYAPLLAAGVKIYEYQPTVLHTKVISVDGHWATLGSANLDVRSLVHNDELNIAFYDSAIVKSLDAVFEDDRAKSLQIIEADWVRRGQGDRWREWATGFIRSQL